MATEERRARINDLARDRGMVRVTDLADELGVSAMTVRRDLDVLVRRGQLEKVFGGAVHRRPTAEPMTGHGHVGIVVPDPTYFFPPIVQSAGESLAAAGWAPTLAISDYQPEQERVLVERFVRDGCAGLLLAPSLPARDDEPEGFDWLFDLPVPVVLIERTARSSLRGAAVCSVRTDTQIGCERAVRHLVELGHDGVALVTHGRAQKGAEVIAGWRTIRESLGLDAERSPLIDRPEANRWPDDAMTAGILSELRDAAASAVLVQNDRVALALTQGARAGGWRLPQDLSVVSYDDELAELAEPSLSAVSAPKRLVGTTAAELLITLLREAAARTPRYVRHVVLEPALVVRGSTAPPDNLRE